MHYYDIEVTITVYSTPCIVEYYVPHIMDTSVIPSAEMDDSRIKVNVGKFAEDKINKHFHKILNKKRWRNHPDMTVL